MSSDDLATEFFRRLSTLNMLLKVSKCHVAQKNIRYLIAQHPDTIAEQIWTEMLDKSREVS